VTKELEEIAQALGAEIVGEIPDVGGGAFGAARLARVYQQRIEEARGQRPPKQTSVELLQIPVQETVARALEILAEWISEAGQSCSATEVAAGLLRSAVERWVEELGWLESREEEARTKYAAAKDTREKAERALRAMLREISGVADRETVG